MLNLNKSVKCHPALRRTTECLTLLICMMPFAQASSDKWTQLDSKSATEYSLNCQYKAMVGGNKKVLHAVSISPELIEFVDDGVRASVQRSENNKALLANGRELAIQIYQRCEQ